MDPSSVKVHGATLNAKLLNEAAPGKSFDLSLIAYDDGFVRLKIEEPGVNRYQISDVTNSKVEERKTTWAVSQSDAKGTTLTVGDASVVLSNQPFRLTVAVNGQPAVSINSRDMFNFEHRRTKEVRGALDCTMHFPPTI